MAIDAAACWHLATTDVVQDTCVLVSCMYGFTVLFQSPEPRAQACPTRDTPRQP